MKEKKIIILSSVILGVLVLTLGVTFAMLSISKTSKNSSLVVGDVYMHYVDTNRAINLENQMPSLTYDETSFFEFTIDGKNTIKDKDIWYEIILNHGDTKSGKTRIKDNLLKFTLTETKNGVTKTVFDGNSYNDLTNKRIWVNTIDKNTTNEVTITYRLYMWISNNTLICAGDIQDNCDYYINGTNPSWSDVYASIKVDVKGDFEEKTITTDEACFTAGVVNTYKLNTNMTTDELNKCVTYFKDWGYGEGETPEAFCEGTGTLVGDTFQQWLDMSDFSREDLIYFETNNIISKEEGAVAILDYDATCGSDVIIPKTIQGYPVTIIGNSETTIVRELSNNLNNTKLNDLNNYNKNYKAGLMKMKLFNGAFQEKNLTSVAIPDSVTIIDYYAFSDNQLTSVVMPDSVTKIGEMVFGNNQLINISIGNGIKYIGNEAFEKADDSNPNLESITINKSCTDVKNIPASNTNTKYYPWLDYDSPYTAPGVTIYGSNNEVCDSF